MKLSPCLVLFVAAVNISAQMIPQEYRPPVYDSSQQIADRITASKVPVVLDFWASWCGPCRMLDPVMEEIKKEYKGRALFIKVNVDAHRQLSSYFRVQGIPAVFILADSTVQNYIQGFNPKANYLKALDSVIAKSKAKRAKAAVEAKPKDTGAAGKKVIQ